MLDHRVPAIVRYACQVTAPGRNAASLLRLLLDLVLLGHERVPEVLLRLIRSLVLGAPERYLLFQAGRDDLGLLDGRGRLILAEPLWRHEALRRRLRAS